MSALEWCPQHLCGTANFTGTFVGRVSPSFFSIGTIRNKGEDLFDVDVQMEGIAPYGSGTLSFYGELSHRVFPPTLVGNIVQ